MSHFGLPLIGDITRVTSARTGRASSWDRSGANSDNWTLLPGETRVLADLRGPGRITHIWMTQSMPRPVWFEQVEPDPDLFRKVLLAIYWDGEECPSVLTPLGDFFCVGHSIASNFQSLPFTGSTKQHGQFGAGCALNCYLPMPFRRSARVELTNEGDWPLTQYFYIDHETFDDDPGDDVAYLHACWRRECPTDGWGHDVKVNTAPTHDAVNLDGAGNYEILDARGAGHYIGCNLSVTNLAGTWWGEGDDMIFIDGEPWPPRLHGTGSEDYFNQAWGMQDNAYLFNGTSLHESVRPPYSTQYVFHLTNPVRFRRRIRVTMEHGHANHLANDWASTAYWYQTEPHRPFSIAPVGERLPLRSEIGSEAVEPEGIPAGPHTRATTRAAKDARAEFEKHVEKFLDRARKKAKREQKWLRQERRGKKAGGKRRPKK